MLRLATVALLLLAGCSDTGTSVGVGVGGGWYSSDPPPPALLAVGAVDSYGVDSEDPGAPVTELHPDRDGGRFELYWYADAEEGYLATVSLSRSGEPGTGVLINEFYCGPYDNCLEDVSLRCRFTRDYRIGCDFTQSEADYHAVNISGQVDGVPDDAYLVVEICDHYSNYCEAGALPVVLR